MKGQYETEYGRVLIGNDVIATYAGSVAVECFGIVGMAAVNMKDGIVKLLKRDYLNHGINVTIDAENNAVFSILQNGDIESLRIVWTDGSVNYVLTSADGGTESDIKALYEKVK